MPDYNEDDLPDELVTIRGHTWEREKFDTDAYNWIRPMDNDEYDWDADSVSLVGLDQPSRIVTLQWDGDWTVDASETAGPNYHRPGYTELISSEYLFHFDTLEKAVEKATELMEELTP